MLSPQASHREKPRHKVSDNLFLQQLAVAEPRLFPGVCLQRRPYAWSLDHAFILIFKIVLTKVLLICHSYVILYVWTNCSQYILLATFSLDIFI